MKLAFITIPVPDVGAALAFYRDTLGWEEAWREGDTTVAFQLPGTDVQLMIDKITEEGARPGPTFLVDSVKEFHESYRDKITFAEAPQEIPGGHMTTFHDPAGNPVHVLDQSTA
ncbi:VOC family protein [Pseudonocardia acaciae]|uniref:VOC family protein n=1 Tax=Pseudonocardia acaciae TaxID=551276 RepID=UPI00048CFD66|nr:VOC family protein [Pseudonocardia acaciae]